jgi:5-methylcytosine-specific restriction enzyme B
MQKLLPKLHGSRRKLCPVLETLGSFCISGDIKIIKDVFEKTDFDFEASNVLYPLSLEKIARMYKGAIDNGFASFAEA